MKIFLSALVLALLSTFDLSQATATTFYERPFPETVKDAPLVVRGKIGANSARWVTGPDGTKRIYTYTELQVDEALKGTLKARSILVRELGGEKDGVGMQVSGTAQFARGEDVVVFLNAPVYVGSPDEAYDIQGMMMGKYNLERKDDGKEYLIGAGIPSSVSPDQRHNHGEAKVPESSQWSLEAVRELIKQQATEEPAPFKDDKKTPVKTVTPPPGVENLGPKLQAQPEATTSPLPASQLQTQEPTSGAGLWFYILSMIGIVTAVAVVLALIRKFSK